MIVTDPQITCPEQVDCFPCSFYFTDARRLGQRALDAEGLPSERKLLTIGDADVRARLLPAGCGDVRRGIDINS
jgi:hypothetical protein